MPPRNGLNCLVVGSMRESSPRKVAPHAKIFFPSLPGIGLPPRSRTRSQLNRLGGRLPQQPAPLIESPNLTCGRRRFIRREYEEFPIRGPTAAALPCPRRANRGATDEDSIRSTTSPKADCLCENRMASPSGDNWAKSALPPAEASLWAPVPSLRTSQMSPSSVV